MAPRTRAPPLQFSRTARRSNQTTVLKARTESRGTGRELRGASVRLRPAMARNETRGKARLPGPALTLRVSTTRDRADTEVVSSPRPQAYASEGFAGFRVGGVGGRRGGPARGKPTSCCSWRPGGGAARQPPARLPCPLRLGIRELEAGRSGGGLQGPAAATCPPDVSFPRGSHPAL